ncbi:MAG: hypothetical protein ACQESF_00180 [Nanobdellota archaeon]
MFSKKGSVEIQFNWVFIIIAGSVLLMFFVKVAGNYKSSSEMEIATEVLDKVGSIASMGQLSSKSSSVITVKDLELRTQCIASSCNEYGCDVDFDFQDMGLPSPVWMEMEPVFSSKHIKGGELIMWSLDWTAPYKVSNFLYLTSNGHKFVFVYDQDSTGSESFARKAYQKFSENEYVDAVLVEESQLSTVPYNAEYLVKFLLFFDPSESLSPDPEILRHHWDVEFFQGDMKSGTVWFSKDEADTKVRGKSYSYYGAPMLMGAIFSDSYEDYKCNVRKAMLKFIKMNSVYYNRADRLYDHFSSMDSANPSSLCQNYFGAELKNYIIGINSSINSSYDLDDVSALESNQDYIEEKNQQALQKDCPRIY